MHGKTLGAETLDGAIEQLADCPGRGGAYGVGDDDFDRASREHLFGEIDHPSLGNQAFEGAGKGNRDVGFAGHARANAGGKRRRAHIRRLG